MTKEFSLTAALANIDATLSAGNVKKALHEWLGTITEMRIAFLHEETSDAKTAESFRSIADQQITLFERIIVAAIEQITLADVCRILAKKQHISNLYEISTYGSSANARGAIWANAVYEINTLCPAQISSILLLCSYSDFGDFEAKAIETQSINLQLGFVLAFISNPFTYTQSQEKWRTWLFSKLESLPDTADITPWAALVAPAAMSCSYASTTDKHKVRAKINKLLSYKLRNIHVPSTEVQMAARPSLLIVAEQMQPDHAMYRCYAPSIRGLKDKFHVTMIVSHGKDDGRLSSMVDVLDMISLDINIEKYIEKIKRHKPDIIYYPSVGMSLHSLAAASIRLAPLQVMTNGHPATSMSPTMDYMILVDEVFGGADLFSEKIILRSKGAHYVGHKIQVPIRIVIREEPNTIRIAIPAYLRKVNAYFLEACNKIASRSQRKVQFVFFPNRVGTEYWEAKQKLETMLLAEVLPRTDYTTYIQNLNQCDIHLSTFPFGSANGIVDSALLGLPIVNLIGREPHSRIDANLVNRYDQPAWLTANTIDQYIEAAVKLIDNDDLRVSISNRILASNPANHLLVDEGATCDDFAQLFYLLYEKHNKIKVKGQKVWDINQLSVL